MSAPNTPIRSNPESRRQSEAILEERTGRGAGTTVGFDSRENVGAEVDLGEVVHIWVRQQEQLVRQHQVRLLLPVLSAPVHLTAAEPPSFCFQRKRMVSL